MSPEKNLQRRYAFSVMTATPSQPPADRLALLYDLSQAFSSSLDLDEVLNQVMDEVIAATRAERGFVMLREDSGELTFPVARGMDHSTIHDPEFQISRGVVEQVARVGQPLLTSDAQSDVRLSDRQSVLGLKLRSILCAPLRAKGRITGVIYVDNRLQAGVFSQEDLDLLNAIASTAAIAIENARLYQIAVEKGRLERELQVAREVQTSLLPRSTPVIEGWDFAAYWHPAREVSGDFYDFVFTAERKLGLVIADVSDKGMPAALFMALARSVIRASVTAAGSPAEAIDQANRLIWVDAPNGMFVTLVYALLDAETGAIIYVNAGHNPPLLYRTDPGQLSALTRTGIVLGVEDGVSYEQRSLQLQPGDFIVLYTDGVTESADANQQEFGEARMRRIVLENARRTAASILDRMVRALADFTGPTTPSDDVTIVIVKRR